MFGTILDSGSNRYGNMSIYDPPNLYS